MRLVLIDGNSILHRAYHALPKTLVRSDGQPVNAIYGFLRMLLKIRKDLSPTHIVVAFDMKGPTFRHLEYEGYKEKRVPMDDELASQIPILKETLVEFGVPVFGVQGFEADDIIGTLAAQTKNQNIETYIVTSDRDAIQLINEHTKVYAPVKGLSETVLFEGGNVKAHFGINPDQVVDYKALRGDPSDSIPGVPGIGEKTAVELLQKYQSLDGVYQNLDKISPRVKKLLEDYKDQAYLSQSLAQITKNAPCDLILVDGEVKDWSQPEAIKALEKLHFKSLIKELTKEKEPDSPAEDDGQMKLF